MSNMTQISLTGGGRSKGQNTAPFVGAYDAIPSLVHVYEPARCTLSAYTGGALLRLRRDSDDAEADFSHVSATDPELDVASITAWLAGSAGYIVSIYDQVSGDTITQAAEAAQPLFVASIQNGHAGGRFDGTSHYLICTYTIGGDLSQPFSVYAGAKLTGVNDNVYRRILDGNTAHTMIVGQRNIDTPDKWAIYTGVVLQAGASDGNANLWSILFNGASSQFWINNASQATGDAGVGNPTGISVGGIPAAASFWKGDWTFTIVADPSHDDAQRLAAQTASNAYWGLY